MAAVPAEGQWKYPNDRVRPNDLIPLAQVAGAAAGAVIAFWEDARLVIPKPQARILEKAGLTAELEGVAGAERMTKTQKGHVIDAIGLALWGRCSLLKLSPSQVNH